MAFIFHFSFLLIDSVRIESDPQIMFELFLFFQLELFLSAGTVCINIYSLVTAIFGMNIPYTWNDDHGYMFKWVSQVFNLLKLVVNVRWILHPV